MAVTDFDTRYPDIKRMVAPTNSGGWRPDLPFDGDDGLKITLRREPGVTPPGFLTVPFRFQAPPLDRYGRAWRFDWTSNQTLRAGEQAREGGRQLERPSFQTMFLDEDLQWLVWTGTLDVQRLLAELKALLVKPAPFRLTVSQPALWGPRPLTNIVAAFTSIEPEERGGELGTEYTQVEFVEVKRQRLEQRRRPRESDHERRHTIKAGESLYDIALKVYHRKSAWSKIKKANGIQGVPPDSSRDLSRWAKAHHRTTLRVPPGDS
jgi:hypothetical protein